MKLITGHLGEKKAEQLLRKKGYHILQKNYRTPLGEIDLICLDRDTLVFVEVKTNHGDEYGAPQERVDVHKQRQIIKTAYAYLQQHRLLDKDCRFDVVSVVIHDAQVQTEHILDAFRIDEELRGVR